MPQANTPEDMERTRNPSQQTMLDGFFASVCGSESLLREVSDRAFAKARERLRMPALVGLNDLVVRRADEAGLIARWCGLRVVAADASLLMPALRPCCLLSRSAAVADQRLFARFLPGPELTRHASAGASRKLSSGSNIGCTSKPSRGRASRPSSSTWPPRSWPTTSPR